MVESKKIEALELSRVRLTVDINKDEAKKEYEKILREYTKKAHIKGFRPGKVPAGILEKKFGESIRMDAAQKIIEESLKTIYESIDEKPLSFESPVLENSAEFSPGEPFSYVISYDVFPQLNLTQLSDFTIDKPQISIGKEAMDYELKELQGQNALVVEKAKGSVEKDNIVDLHYYELDDDKNEVPDSKREISLSANESGFSTHGLNDSIIGLKLNKEAVIEVDGAGTVSDTGDAPVPKKSIKITVDKIKERQLPPIDNELAQDIDEKFQTLDDLKKHISEQLKEKRDDLLKRSLKAAVLEKIIEANPIVLPASMVTAELENKWRSFASRISADENIMHAILQQRGSSKDDIFSEWRPEAEKSLKGQLIVQKLIEDRKIKASEEEIAAKIHQIASQSSMSDEQVRKYYEEQKMMNYIEHDINEDSLISQLLEENTTKKGKKIKYLDFIGKKA